MSFFAISDLHMPGGDDKPMDVFGSNWTGHIEKICSAWRNEIKDDDVVLIPGDFSWAMTQEAAMEDLALIGSLPGRKVISKGNHDFWWDGIGKVRRALPEGMYAIQNDCVVLNDRCICGTRGWLLPQDQKTENDAKIYRRELIRLDMTLSDAEKKAQGLPVVCMLHYPPLTEGNRETEVTQILKKHAVKDVIYGHVHGAAIKTAFTGEQDGINYTLVSCDALSFAPIRLF